MKKRFLAGLIALCMILSFVPSVSATPDGGDPVASAAENSVTPTLQQGELSVKVQTDRTSQLVVALYRESGQMMDLRTVEVSAGSRTVTVSGLDETAHHLKVFLLDGENGTPLCQSLRVQDAASLELAKAAELGYSTEKAKQKTISGAEFSLLLDHFVALNAPEKLAEWKGLYPALRASEEPLHRFDALTALFHATRIVGGSFSEVNTPPLTLALSLDHSWDYNYITWELFGDPQSFGLYDIGDTGFLDPNFYLDAAAYYYVLGRNSPFNGEYLFSVDAASNSLRVWDHCTYLEALQALVRLMCSNDPSLMPALPADEANAAILTPELIAKSQVMPSISSEEHPIWNGFVLQWDPTGVNNASLDALEAIADWGFNSVRLMINYRALFDGKDAHTPNAAGLNRLDTYVAAAIRLGINLNICLSALPGRNFTIDHNTYLQSGEFDLFVNKEQQEETNHIWWTLAARYSDVSNFNLTFTPFWEATNKNLSTGLPAPDYDEYDVANYLGIVTDVIRAESPDRLIIYEATAMNGYADIIRESTPSHEVAKEKGNMIVSYNFCENPFAYAHMNAEEGNNIDDSNHSMLTPQYPTKYYCLSRNISTEKPLTLKGCLPAGTVVDLYLEDADSANLCISADGSTIYEEALGTASYNKGYMLSRSICFASSDKKISLTLAEDTDVLSIAATQGSFNWCGMELTLPEEYARDRWYYASDYDVFLGLEEKAGVVLKHDARILIYPTEGLQYEVTVYDDLTYSTPEIWQESSAETIEEWANAIDGFESNCIVRYEGANFSGVEWKDMRAYYTDLLNTFTAHGYSWWSNDWGPITDKNDQTIKIANCPSQPYGEFEYFNRELLQLLQSHIVSQSP